MNTITDAENRLTYKHKTRKYFPTDSHVLRFLEKVNKNGTIPTHVPNLDKCWIWKGATISNGYGYSWAGRLIVSHRLSWIIHYGIIPEDKYVLHKCDNRLCVNPAHLWLGTKKDNMADCVKKGRLNHCSILNQNDIIKIRVAYIQNRKTLTQIAKDFEITCGHVQLIISGALWKKIMFGTVSVMFTRLSKRRRRTTLSDFQINQIKQRYYSNRFSLKQIAQEFNIHHFSIWRIVHR